MKFLKIPLSLLIFFILNTTTAQDILGDWKTVDDDSGVEKSIVEVYEEEGKIYGKVKRILKEDERDVRCTECDGDQKNQKVEGMVILKNLSKDGEKFSGGSITDPENGKTYDVKVWLNEDDSNTLMVRGYVSLLYRTQKWKRVED